MLRRLTFTALFIVTLVVLLGAPWQPAIAQTHPSARAPYALPVYRLPDSSTMIVGVLTAQEEIVLEARNADGSWILGHSADGSTRGWLHAARLNFENGTQALSLPVSQEEMFHASAQSLVSDYPHISLNSLPVLPTRFGRAAEIAATGRALGLDPRAISKVGDCLTESAHFLTPFAGEAINLGGHTSLSEVVAQFKASFGETSLAAYDGLVTSAVLDPTFANPGACQPGETPLRCEYRVRKPAVAIIMFGAQDLLFTPAHEFNRNLRQIVHETIAAGVVPLLSTFPGHNGQWERAIQYNQIVVQVALDYDVPLLNLFRALEPLPNHGLTSDGRHLTPPITHPADLSAANVQQGYPLRNLLTLQALDAVWQEVAESR